MKIAIVGSGVSGLAATWVLNEYSSHEIHLYEADGRPGGHANTVSYQRKGSSNKIDVDTGFIVLNPTTYPNFLRFLKMSRIPVVDTEMTFSVTRDRGAFEWAGKSLSTVFCQAQNLWRPSMWRMIWDVLRFNACAPTLLADDKVDETFSIGQYLEREGFSDAFRDDYLIPMTAAIWSTPPDMCATDFPAKSLLRFMHNHHLLQLTGKPSWLTIPGGSKVYVDRILSRLPTDSLHLNSPVETISTAPDPAHQDDLPTTLRDPTATSRAPKGKVLLTTRDGAHAVYDHVVMACHSDTTMKILDRGYGMTDEERDILGGVGWSKNRAVLHSDAELMPKCREAYSCWNYLTESITSEDGSVKPNVNRVALTYLMNDLQHISENDHGLVLVTLNPPFEPRPETVAGSYQYDHPVLDAQAIRSQNMIHNIQNSRGITYAGAWLSYGFHEDGFSSGMRAVLDYIPGVKLPFQPKAPDRIIPSWAWIVALVFRVLELVRTILLVRLLGFVIRWDDVPVSKRKTG